jgi:2-polyprenyl-6-methoxyphenol hydroxylase-like FAD-dependent oxidoreductase
MMTQVMETQVLIIGAGPTGLTLAASLRTRGIDTLLVDRLSSGANTSRAGVIHARTLEVLESIDVTERLLARGLKVPTFHVRERDHALLTIEFDRLPSAYRFTLMCPQDITEQVLLERLHELGGQVERPLELTKLSAQTEYVDAELSDGRRVRAQWVVGCDGMHSRVREEAGIAFEGDEYAPSFVLADVHMDWPLSREEVNLFFAPEGVLVIAPLPGERFRVVGEVAREVDVPEQPSAAFVQALLDARGPARVPARVRDVLWSSRFRVHHRVARTLREGRVLLCGDAAHVHSPAGGQGMNTGIQDAASLAELLPESAGLDAWARERRAVATRVVAMTDRMTRMATLKSRTALSLRNLALGCVDQLPPVRRAIAKNLAELYVR